MIDIVLLTAKARSGKDTAARVFVEHGYTQLSFAEPIREFIIKLCGFANLEELDLKKNEPQEILGGQTPRYAMQTLGTEWGRETINTKLWTSVVRDKIVKNNLKKIVISDCRFDNEVEDILEFFPASVANVQLIEIIRPENTDALTADAAQHKSESGLSGSFFRNKIIKNDGTLEQFIEKIEDLF